MSTRVSGSRLGRVSLADSEGPLGQALGESRLLGGLTRLGNSLHDRLHGWIQGSRLAAHSEALALYAVCALFVASPFVGTGINAALVLLALALVLFRLFCQPDTRATFSSLDLIVLVFIAMHVVATGFSAFPVPSLKGLAKMGIYWSAYFCFRQVIQTRRAFYTIMAALFIAGTLEAAFGIYQWIIGVEPLANWEDPEALDPLTRVYSTLMNPNLLAGYLLPIFPLAAIAAARWSLPWRVLPALAAVTAPICIWFTYSRGAYIGVAAGIATFGLMALALSWPRLKANRTLMGGAFAGITGAVALLVLRVATSPALQERLMSIFTLRGHSSNSFRMNVWIGVWRMLHDNWLFGVGIGNTAFRKMYSLYMLSGFEALGAYNILLEVLAEMGVIGLIVFVWLWVAFIARNLYTFWHGDHEARWWAVAIIAALVGTLVMGMVDTVYYRPAVQLQFWLLLAATIAIAPAPVPVASGVTESRPTSV